MEKCCFFVAKCQACCRLQDISVEIVTILFPRSQVLGYLHMSPVDLAGPLTGSNFTLGSHEKFQLGFRDQKKPKASCGAKFEKQSKHGKTQSYNFRAYYSFGNSYSCITFVKWDAYDEENMAGKARRCRIHPAFIPVNGLKCFFFMEEFSTPSYRDLGKRASPPSHMNTSKLL